MISGQKQNISIKSALKGKTGGRMERFSQGVLKYLKGDTSRDMGFSLRNYHYDL